VKVIFTGTSPFAVPSLEAVIASSHEVLAVVTQPDKPHGRGLEMRISPVKEVALAHSIPVLQPEQIAEPGSIAQAKSYGPIGTMIVVAYGQKIPSELLIWPKFGVVNVHGSILPKYRGAAPIQHALIAGETQTGVTTMLMDEGWDTGDILLQQSLDILPNENAGELSERLALLGAGLLTRTLEGLEAGAIAAIPQDPELASRAHSLARDAGFIDWTRDAHGIVDLVRGCTPRPGAFTRIKGAQVKIWKSAVADCGGVKGEPGQVTAIDDLGITIAAGDGCVRLIDVQPESRKQMSAADFARGAKLARGDQFEKRGSTSQMLA